MVSISGFPRRFVGVPASLPLIAKDAMNGAHLHQSPRTSSGDFDRATCQDRIAILIRSLVQLVGVEGDVLFARGFFLVAGFDPVFPMPASGGMIRCMESMMEERITIEAGKRSGQPCIRGLRITVWDVLGWLAAGKRQEEILSDYPELEPEDFRAVFEYATRLGRRVAL